jgi:hypothetical protein
MVQVVDLGLNSVTASPTPKRKKTSGLLILYKKRKPMLLSISMCNIFLYICRDFSVG